MDITQNERESKPRLADQTTSCSAADHERICANATTFEAFAIPIGYRIGGGLPARQLGICRRCHAPIDRNLSAPERGALALATGRSDT